MKHFINLFENEEAGTDEYTYHSRSGDKITTDSEAFSLSKEEQTKLLEHIIRELENGGYITWWNSEQVKVKGTRRSNKKGIVWINTAVEKNLQRAIRANDTAASDEDKYIPINVGTAKGKTLNTYMRLSYEDSTGIACNKLTGYEVEILNACMSLSYKGDEEFTLLQIYREAFKTKRVTAKQKEDTHSAINKMRKMFVYIDYSEQALNKPANEIQEQEKYTAVIRSTYLLPVDEILLLNDRGIEEAAYQFIKTPPLLEHAREVNRLSTESDKYLRECVKRISNNPGQLVVMKYIERCINQAKRQGLNTVKMSYASVYDYLSGESDTAFNKKESYTRREWCKNVLNIFNDLGHISSWSEYDKKGVQIVLNNKKELSESKK